MSQTSLFNNELRLSVSQFNELINLHLNSIGLVVVEGEITEFSISGRGGVNIVLKDKTEKSIVSVTGYAPKVQGINMVEKGMEVAIWGKPQLYSPYGKFSISIEKISPVGEGALAKAFVILKEKLEKEGLFDLDRKRPLPELVTKIALITAKDSAAQTDFLKILRENEIALDIDFYPVAVQGIHATKEVISALKYAEQKDYDCIVITRGGGSLEDLNAFNDESMAREIFSSKIPTLVAIGHERDVSIAELASDIRASTPSQASYYFVTNTENLFKKLDLLADHAYQQLDRHITKVEREISIEGIYEKIFSKLRENNSILYRFGNDFESKILFKLNNYKHTVLTSRNSLEKFENYVKEITNSVDHYDQLLQTLNPNNVIKRGYAIVRDSKQNILKSVKDAKVGGSISTVLRDGKIISIVEKIENN